MTRKTARLSWYGLLRSDYVSFLAAVVPLVVWGLYLALDVFGVLPNPRRSAPVRKSEDAAFFLHLALVVTAISLPVFGARWRSFHGFYTNGQEMLGRITGVGFFRDRGHVSYTYHYNNSVYNISNAIMKWRRTTALDVGQEVVILVNRQNPRRAIIRDLYTSDPGGPLL